jgi:hypothetical protein
LDLPQFIKAFVDISREDKGDANALGRPGLDRPYQFPGGEITAEIDGAPARDLQVKREDQNPSFVAISLDGAQEDSTARLCVSGSGGFHQPDEFVPEVPTCEILLENMSGSAVPVLSRIDECGLDQMCNQILRIRSPRELLKQKVRSRNVTAFQVGE